MIEVPNCLLEMTMQECCVLVTGVFLRRVYIISRAVAPAKHMDIPVGFQRENGLFVNLNYRESYKIISPLRVISTEPAGSL